MSRYSALTIDHPMRSLRPGFLSRRSRFADCSILLLCRIFQRCQDFTASDCESGFPTPGVGPRWRPQSQLNQAKRRESRTTQRSCWLKELTEANGVAGYESEAGSVIRRYLEPIGEITQDKMGILICRRVGDTNGPKVMLAGYMDEVGFMVKHVTKEGFIKFTCLGGWWDQVLLAQRVLDRQG